MMFCATLGHMVSCIVSSFGVSVAVIMAAISSVALTRPVCRPPRGLMIILNSLRGSLPGMRAALVKDALIFLTYCALVGGDLLALVSGLPGVAEVCEASPR